MQALAATHAICRKPHMHVLAIDVGVANFAYVLAQIIRDAHTRMWAVHTIEEMRRVDIREFTCDRSTCTLHHARCVTDYLRHIFTLHPAFSRPERVLIEQQPPKGYVEVQELLRNEYRGISVMVSPMSVQAHYGLRRFKGPEAYEKRKEWVVAFATRTLPEWGWSLGEGGGGAKLPGIPPRLHDVADAWLILRFHISQLNTAALKGISKYFLPRILLKRAREEEEEPAKRARAEEHDAPVGLVYLDVRARVGAEASHKINFQIYEECARARTTCAGQSTPVRKPIDGTILL